MNCGFMYEIFGKYQPMWTEYHIPEQLMQKARSLPIPLFLCWEGIPVGKNVTDTSKVIMNLPNPKELLEQVCCVFPHVIVVLNINGMIDMQWVNAYSAIKAVVFLGIPGEEGCGALADILTGL